MTAIHTCPDSDGAFHAAAVLAAERPPCRARSMWSSWASARTGIWLRCFRGPELTAEGQVTAAVAPVTPHQRISLTLGALQSCKQVITVMAGDKRQVLERALEAGPPEDMPIRSLLHQQQVPASIFTT